MKPFTITLNGREYTTACDTLSALIQSLTLTGGSIAIAVNDTVIPSAEYAQQTLANGDCVEIIHAVSGG
jgi:thiamine biosynthesis protein ThiS